MWSDDMFPLQTSRIPLPSDITEAIIYSYDSIEYRAGA